MIDFMFSFMISFCVNKVIDRIVKTKNIYTLSAKEKKYMKRYNIVGITLIAMVVAFACYLVVMNIASKVL